VEGCSITRFSTAARFRNRQGSTRSEIIALCEKERETARNPIREVAQSVEDDHDCFEQEE
jgi:hypothetical protein